jgi:hypothetical protein
MKRKHVYLALALMALLIVLVAGNAALAQTSPSFNLEWNTLGGGGGPASSSSYAVHSTMGQAASGASPPSGDNYRVSGGFWGGGGFEQYYQIYLPIVLRNAP